MPVGRSVSALPSINALTASLAWWDKREQLPERFAELGLDPAAPRVEKWLAIAAALRGFPRHLTQHTGGFVISRGPLSRLVPVENAAMPERSVIQWDKDDLDALGLMKVDILALGMLSAIRRTLDMVGEQYGRPLRMHEIPAEDPDTYEMLCHADSMGVFQVESRAQMAMLPRLQPRGFYDLVVEVALVRPGPIQGDMVHPYLKRRQKKERIEKISPAVDAVLARTFGVPIFQEQVMQLAVVAANFTPGEADQLRRSMAAWRRKGGLEHFEQKLLAGMAANGLPEAFARRIIAQIQGFGEYGFPESHAASFALLVYASAWLKRHHPAAFLCGLLNSQPMGFYSPSLLIQDARRHGVTPCCRPMSMPATGRAGSMPAGRCASACAKSAAWRRWWANALRSTGKNRPFSNVADLAARAGLQRRDLDLLAAADALHSLAGHRRQAAWAATAAVVQGDLFDGSSGAKAESGLPAPSVGENLVADYRSLGLTLRPIR
jgi:error-prone DNA polymerase